MAPPVLENLDQKLAYLGKESSRIVRKAMLDGAKVLVPIMQSAAASAVAKDGTGRVRSTGKMQRSINARNVKRIGSMIGAKSGLDVGKMPKGSDIDTHHGGGGHLFVSGTDHRYAGTKQKRRGGQYSHTNILRGKTGIIYRGRAPAHLPSFIKTATASAEGAVTSVITETLTTGFDAAISRIG